MEPFTSGGGSGTTSAPPRPKGRVWRRSSMSFCSQELCPGDCTPVPPCLTSFCAYILGLAGCCPDLDSHVTWKGWAGVGMCLPTTQPPSPRLTPPESFWKLG